VRTTLKPQRSVPGNAHRTAQDLARDTRAAAQAAGQAAQAWAAASAAAAEKAGQPAGVRLAEEARAAEHRLGQALEQMQRAEVREAHAELEAAEWAAAQGPAGRAGAERAAKALGEAQRASAAAVERAATEGGAAELIRAAAAARAAAVQAMAELATAQENAQRAALEVDKAVTQAGGVPPGTRFQFTGAGLETALPTDGALAAFPGSTSGSLWTRILVHEYDAALRGQGTAIGDSR